MSEGLVDECAAVNNPGRVDDVARLPCADKSGRQSPVSVLDFDNSSSMIGYDEIDHGEVLELEPDLVRFLAETSPSAPGALPTIDEMFDDDNPCVDLSDCVSECGSSDSRSECDSVSSSVGVTRPSLLPVRGKSFHLSDMDSATLSSAVNEADPYVKALYRMNELVDRGMSRCEAIDEAASVGGDEYARWKAAPRAHMDGGSMASTCHEEYLFWGPITKFPKDRRPVLSVADNRKHYAEGYGILRVPALVERGYVEVKALYTPTLKTIILSPDAMRKELGCRGYLTSLYAATITRTATFRYAIVEPACEIFTLN